MNLQNEKFQGYLIIIVAVFTWSFSEIIVKRVQGQADAASLSFYRFFFGGLFLLFILFVRKDLKHIKRMFKNNWSLFLMSSAFAFGISNILYFLGLLYTQANIAATIYSTYTIWSTIFSIFILNERNNIKLKLVGLVLGTIGVTLLMTNLNVIEIISVEYLFGNILVLIGALLWGLYTVLNKKIQLNEPDITNNSLKLCTLSSFLASTPNFILMIIISKDKSYNSYDLEVWLQILFLGFICTGLGIFLLFEGLRKVEVSKGMSLALLKPIFVTFLAYFILNEMPSIILFISISLIIIAICLINQNRPNEPKT